MRGRSRAAPTRSETAPWAGGAAGRPRRPRQRRATGPSPEPSRAGRAQEAAEFRWRGAGPAPIVPLVMVKAAVTSLDSVQEKIAGRYAEGAALIGQAHELASRADPEAPERGVVAADMLTDLRL